MSAIYIIGLLAVICYRAYAAGSRNFSYHKDSYRYPGIDEDKVMGYILLTIPMAAAWFIAVPAMVLFYLGQKRAAK